MDIEIEYNMYIYIERESEREIEKNNIYNIVHHASRYANNE